ncbi:MAG: thiamine-binding protein [Thermodesulfobacteriota bacterium]
MSLMKIAVFPMDAERTLGIGDFLMTFLLLSREKGVECRPTSSGAVIEGDNETLLEILDRINSTSFGALGNRVAISMEFNESRDGSPTQSEIRLPNELIVTGTHLKEGRRKTESGMRALHDKVVDRLARYVKEEEEFLE